MARIPTKPVRCLACRAESPALALPGVRTVKCTKCRELLPHKNPAVQDFRFDKPGA
jgi:hypothetical protein